MELNVTTQDQVRDDIRTLQWAIVDKVAAVTILEETETQVLDMLVLRSFPTIVFKILSRLFFIPWLIFLSEFVTRTLNWRNFYKQWTFQWGKVTRPKCLPIYNYVAVFLRIIYLSTCCYNYRNVVSPATIQKQQVSVVVIGGGFTVSWFTSKHSDHVRLTHRFILYYNRDLL